MRSKLASIVKSNKTLCFLAKKTRDEFRGIFDPYPYRKGYRKNKLIFIHIPKNGGKSVLAKLKVKPGDHCTYREFQQANPSRYSSYVKFAVVREPISRFVSAFNYLKGGGNQTSDVDFKNSVIGDSGINEFIQFKLNLDLVYHVTVFRPQSYFVVNEYGEVETDYLFDLDSLGAQLSLVSDLPWFKNLSLGKLNQSEKSSERLSPESINIIRSVYEEDFRLYEKVKDSPDGYYRKK